MCSSPCVPCLKKIRQDKINYGQINLKNANIIHIIHKEKWEQNNIQNKHYNKNIYYQFISYTAKHTPLVQYHQKK